MRPRTFLAWAAGVVAVGLLLPHAAATPRNRVQKHVPASPASVRPGMVVGVDPETGQLGMPTAEQMTELSPREQSMISRSGAGLVQVHHPDGSVSINLQGRFQEFVIARNGPDGKPVYGCLDDARALRRALQTRPVPPLEEK